MGSVQAAQRTDVSTTGMEGPAQEAFQPTGLIKLDGLTASWPIGSLMRDHTCFCGFPARTSGNALDTIKPSQLKAITAMALDTRLSQYTTNVLDRGAGKRHRMKMPFQSLIEA